MLLLATLSAACEDHGSVAAPGGSAADGVGHGRDASEVAVGGDAPAGMPHCDLSVCEGRNLIGMTLSPCCLPTGVCGVGVKGFPICFETWHVDNPSQLEAGTRWDPPVLDPRCKDRVIAFPTDASFVLTGCCAPDGMCGYSAETLNRFGLSASASCTTGGVLTDASVPCEYPRALGIDGGAGADAGVAPDAQPAASNDAAIPMDAAPGAEPG